MFVFLPVREESVKGCGNRRDKGCVRYYFFVTVSLPRNPRHPDGAGSSQVLPAHPLLGAVRLCRHHADEQPRRDGAGLRELHRPAAGRNDIGGAGTREPEKLVQGLRGERPCPTGADPNGGRLPLQPQLAFLQRGALRNVSGGVARQVTADGRHALRLPFQAGASEAQQCGG